MQQCGGLSVQVRVGVGTECGGLRPRQCRFQQANIANQGIAAQSPLGDVQQLRRVR